MDSAVLVLSIGTWLIIFVRYVVLEVQVITDLRLVALVLGAQAPFVVGRHLQLVVATAAGDRVLRTETHGGLGLAAKSGVPAAGVHIALGNVAGREVARYSKLCSLCQHALTNLVVAVRQS